MPAKTLNIRALRQALNLRDLTDPDDGPHAMQMLIGDILSALQKEWGCEVRIHRESPIISVEDNYNKLRYPPDGAARDARYSRYVTAGALLRTMASAMVPGAMRSIAQNPPDDVLLACPGLVYRRDCIDRLHTGEPHQLDLWRVHRSKRMGTDELRQMIQVIVETALPAMQWRTEARVHPYTLDGLQIDVNHKGEWIEIGECGIAHPEIIAENIPNIQGLGGLALGLGMDRLLMIRKDVRDMLAAVDSRGRRDRGGAPGGAARPKQAVFARGSSCGARHARSAGGWQHPFAWRGHDLRRLSALHSPFLGRIS